MEQMEPSLQNSLHALAEDAKTFFLSPKEVGERLKTIASVSFAARLAIQITFEDQQYVWGEDPENLTVLSSGVIANGIEFKVLAATSAVNEADQRLLQHFSAIAKNLWGPDVRQMGALAWKRQAVEDMLPPSLARLAHGKQDRRLAIVFVDLDKFKQLNDQTDHNEGDRALRAINRQLHDLTRKFGGLAFNPSGDEFYLILPYGDVVQLLCALRDMRATVLDTRYGGAFGKDLRVDLTIGVNPTVHFASLQDIKAAVAEAEALTKTADEHGKQTKRRGKITLSGTVENRYDVCSTQQMLQLGAILIRRRLFDSPFADPRLNLISILASSTFNDSNSELLTEEVAKLLTWLDVQYSIGCHEDELLVALGSSDLSKASIALAVAHGLASRQAKAVHAEPQSSDDAYEVSVFCAADGSRAAVLIAGKVVWGDAKEGDKTVLVVNIASQGHVPSRCVVGVQIGFNDLPMSYTGIRLPDDVFDSLVLIDERPVSGGGLPDFWQVAIAQTYSAVGRHGGDAHVIVWGAAAPTSETYFRLSGDKALNVDELSRVAELSSEMTRALQNNIKERLKIVDVSHPLVDILYDAISATYVPQSLEPVVRDALRFGKSVALPRPMLHRESLLPEDGLRCRDAAQAYPLVIDLLRKGTRVRSSCDDAEQELKEVLGFKLILEQPTKDKIPAYLSDQSKELDDYAERVLLRPNGYLRRGLEESGQVAAVLKHLASYLATVTPARTTRRACLVVPHEVTDSGDPSPLGLVSVWASPRVPEIDRNVIDFVFVWRTVEAFIGLPYSLYGSIRLAEQLISQVSEAVQNTSNGFPPAIGELTYIALSLHVRVNEFHRRIAKRIVDVSSD